MLNKIPYKKQCSKQKKYYSIQFSLIPCKTCFAALNVLYISIATVMGPTPPGTGVMCPAS